MTTATKKLSKATIPNGLAIEPRFGQADDINNEAAEIAASIVELQEHRAELLATAWEMPLNVIVANADEYKRDKAALLDRIIGHLANLQKRLPSLVPGCRRAVDKAEQDYATCLDQLEETFRASGIDESSLPGGEYAASNPEETRQLFRKRLASEPPALARMGAWNTAKQNLAVLESMLPRVASAEWAATYLKFPAVQTDLPDFVQQLFA